MTDKRLDVGINVEATGNGARQAISDLDSVKGSAEELGRSLKDNASDLSGIGKDAQDAAGQLKDAGDGIKESGDKVEGAGKQYSSFRDAISGLRMLQSNDIATQFQGIGNVLQSVARNGVALLGPASGFAGAIAVAAGAIGLIAKKWKENSPEAIEEMKRLQDAADGVGKAFVDIDKVQPSFEGVLQAINDVRKAYGDLRADLATKFQAQERVAGTKDRLALAELSLEREQAVSGAPPAAKEGLLALYKERERQLASLQQQTAKQREIEQAEDRLALLLEERAKVEERIKILDDKIEAAKNAQASMEQARQFATSPSGVQAFGAGAPFASQAFDAKASVGSGVVSAMKERAELARSLGDARKGLQLQVGEIEAEIAALGKEMAELRISAEAVDVTAIPKAKDALEGIRNLMRDAQNVVESARQSGDNRALQDALQNLGNLRAWESKFSDFISGARDAASKASSAADNLKSVVGKVGTEVEEVASAEAGKVNAAVERTKADLSGATSTVLQATEQGTGAVGEGMRRLGDAVLSFSSGVTSRLGQLEGELSAQRGALERAQADADLALRQVRNTR